MRIYCKETIVIISVLSFFENPEKNVNTVFVIFGAENPKLFSRREHIFKPVLALVRTMRSVIPSEHDRGP